MNNELMEQQLLAQQHSQDDRCPRISVFKVGDHRVSTVITVHHDNIDTLCEDLARKMNMSSHQPLSLYNNKGAKITDINLLRDDDILYISGQNDFQGGSSVLQQTGNNAWIKLNIGGHTFCTTKATLISKEPNSMLARMFSADNDFPWFSSVDDSGAYLIDRNGAYFAPLLNYLRHGELILDNHINPAGVLEEAKFFGLTGVIPHLEQLLQVSTKPTDSTPITRRELILSLMTTPANCELRCQGLNFTGADLSRLDLRFVNFKYAILREANLSGANLSNVNLERADLTKAVLDGANMMGVKMLCAQLEGASMKGCNFEDPAGSRANMEGANMKHVVLLGSHMAGVNLRVANLKNSNLQNCDLRGAVLAGSDLENCDLSGCDLQEANLRGANLVGAAFAQMLNALHMSQTLNKS